MSALLHAWVVVRSLRIMRHAFMQRRGSVKHENQFIRFLPLVVRA